MLIDLRNWPTWKIGLQFVVSNSMVNMYDAERVWAEYKRTSEYTQECEDASLDCMMVLALSWGHSFHEANRRREIDFSAEYAAGAAAASDPPQRISGPPEDWQLRVSEYHPQLGAGALLAAAQGQ